MEASEKPNIAALFEGNSKHIRNPKFRRAASALQWRQKYLGCDIYSLSIGDDSDTVSARQDAVSGACNISGTWTLELHQVKNGEESGVGTGCSVWPAAHVLVKYLEQRYKSQGGMQGIRFVTLAFLKYYFDAVAFRSVYVQAV
jgi:hypothetical protein